MYPELVGNSVLKLIVAATETGGRCNRDTLTLLEQAAWAKAQSAPVPLQKASGRAWLSRWKVMLAVAVQDALAATLTSEGVGELDGKNGYEPLATDVWLDG